MKKISIICSIICLIIPNLPVVNYEIAMRYDYDYYRYSNQDGSFTFQQNVNYKSGYLHPRIIEAFIKETQPLPENQIIYRTYKINPLCFWRWSLYLYPMTSNYEYKSWDEIEKNRQMVSGSLLQFSKWQDF